MMPEIKVNEMLFKFSIFCITHLVYTVIYPALIQLCVSQWGNDVPHSFYPWQRSIRVKYHRHLIWTNWGREGEGEVTKECILHMALVFGISGCGKRCLHIGEGCDKEGEGQGGFVPGVYALWGIGKYPGGGGGSWEFLYSSCDSYNIPHWRL